MQVMNRVIFISENETVKCKKCYLDLTYQMNNPYLAHDDWQSNNGYVSCKAEKYLVCPNCGKEIILETWTEEF